MIIRSFRSIGFLLSVLLIFSLNVQADTKEVNEKKIVLRSPSDIQGVDFVITYDPESLSGDYKAETFSSISDKHPYAARTGADKGLVQLVFEDNRQVKEYTIPKEEIRAVIRVKYDMEVLNRTDIIFTKKNIVMVETSSRNAGMFVGSDVYVFSYPESGFEYTRFFKEGGKDQLLKLYAGLFFFNKYAQGH